MIEKKVADLPNVTNNEWAVTKCDKYDYLIAVFCGAAAGIIDVLFVGEPNDSRFGESVDKFADKFVQKAAQFFWKNDRRSTGRSKTMPQSLEQCISYLEQAFPVNYDARYAPDLNVDDGVLTGMRPLNHHLLSLAHSPDIVGLIFSIIDQFAGYGTFVEHGKLINVVPKKISGAIPYMQGSNLPSMLFCGFVNWIGHLISDIVGSSSTRKIGKDGRGAGIPMPFYEMFLACDFGNIEGKTFAQTMIKVFEQGYDLRFAATMTIPVLFEELAIRVVWTIRQKFFRKKTWEDSIPDSCHADLRIMLIVGNGTLCLVDGVGAVATSSGTPMGFILHLNFVAWVRLVIIVLKDLKLRYGPVIEQNIKKFVDSVMSEIHNSTEKRKIEKFIIELAEYDNELDRLFKDFVIQLEAEYKELYIEMAATFDNTSDAASRAAHSVKLAELCGVSEDKIVRNHDDLDKIF